MIQLQWYFGISISRFCSFRLIRSYIIFKSMCLCFSRRVCCLSERRFCWTVLCFYNKLERFGSGRTVLRNSNADNAFLAYGRCHSARNGYTIFAVSNVRIDICSRYRCPVNLQFEGGGFNRFSFIGYFFFKFWRERRYNHRESFAGVLVDTDEISWTDTLVFHINFARTVRSGFVFGDRYPKVVIIGIFPIG